jgi:hypothetical protein
MAPTRLRSRTEARSANGGTIRGTVVSSEPGTSVKIIEMGGTEVRVIPWSEVKDVERGKFAPKQAPAPSPKPEAKTTPLDPAGSVTVEIASDKPGVELDVVVARSQGVVQGYRGAAVVTTTSWQRVCVAPCEAQVSPEGQFFVGGDTPATGQFTLPRDGERVKLTIQSGSTCAYAGGSALAWYLGAPALIVGVIILVLGGTNDSREMLIGGGIATGAGAAALAGGIVLMLSNRTRVTTESGQQLAGIRATPSGFVF